MQGTTVYLQHPWNKCTSWDSHSCDSLFLSSLHRVSITYTSMFRRHAIIQWPRASSCNIWAWSAVAGRGWGCKLLISEVLITINTLNCIQRSVEKNTIASSLRRSSAMIDSNSDLYNTAPYLDRECGRVICIVFRAPSNCWRVLWWPALWWSAHCWRALWWPSLWRALWWRRLRVPSGGVPSGAAVACGSSFWPLIVFP